MYYFNPDNDLALANFSANYTPPASALKIAEDLSLLPMWYAPTGSTIVAQNAENHPFFDAMKKQFSLSVSLIPFSEIGLHTPSKIVPWGWNPALKKKLSDAGVRAEILPTATDLELLRQYSGRQNAVKMLHELKLLDADFCGESALYANHEEVLAHLAARSGNSVLKMPNSGSGKGLMWVLGTITEKQIDWCKRVVRLQGGVVVEPVLDKIVDFAMEFYLQGNSTRFAGYSLFKTFASGAYTGNYLLSDENIEKRLSDYISFEKLVWLKKFYQEALPRYFPNYQGFIGVDMMICHTAHGCSLQPCVEINMRMNMGMVAHIFYDRFVSRGSSGIFVVDFFKNKGDAFAKDIEMREKYPLQIENNRIITGYLPLTPAQEQSNYVAYAIVGENDIDFE